MSNNKPLRYEDQQALIEQNSQLLRENEQLKRKLSKPKNRINGQSQLKLRIKHWFFCPKCDEGSSEFILPWENVNYKPVCLLGR